MLMWKMCWLVIFVRYYNVRLHIFENVSDVLQYLVKLDRTPARCSTISYQLLMMQYFYNDATIVQYLSLICFGMYNHLGS